MGYGYLSYRGLFASVHGLWRAGAMAGREVSNRQGITWNDFLSPNKTQLSLIMGKQLEISSLQAKV